MRTAVLALVMSLALPCRAEYPGAVFLMIIPDARSSALGGCGVANQRLGANHFFNPAAAGFGSRAAATWSHANWLPGLYPEMSYEYAGTEYRITPVLAAGLDLTYLETGKTDVFNAHGRYLGSYRSWDLAVQTCIAYRPTRWLSAGLGVKIIHSMLVPEWVFDSMPELGLEAAGSATTPAVDLGMQCRPLGWLGLGAAFQNYGPGIRYTMLKGGPTDPLPTLLRFGLDASLPLPGPFELRFVSDVWRDIVSDFRLYGRTAWDSVLSLSEQLEFGAGVELRVAGFASIRLGYFEDVPGQRGGILYDPERRRIGLLRYLTTPGLGKPLSWDLCWGCGVEYEGFSFDVGVDESIYDFPTRNVRFQLSWQMR